MKKITLSLLLGCLALLLSACSGANCVSGNETIPNDLGTGQQGGIGTEATFCTDKEQYNIGDIVHVTLTVTNRYREALVLDGGGQPLMDICGQGGCWSQTQPAGAVPTHLVLEPGQAHTIQWEIAPEQATAFLNIYNIAYLGATWIGTDGGVGDLRLDFIYGERRGLP
ncbi:MAG TPA: hypothetical protein VJG32_09990 [Anaerolineae bacterium]|nr:hypothetical protein [Anaerolineae bacterium]